MTISMLKFALFTFYVLRNCACVFACVRVAVRSQCEVR
jgi:hypothetical protein